MPPPEGTPKEEEEPQPEEQARPKSRSRKARRRSSARKAQEERDQELEERGRSRNEMWNQAYTGLKSRNDWTPTEEAESPSKSPAGLHSRSHEPRRLDLEQHTPNPFGIATPLNEGLTERFCREEACHEEEEEQETAPSQEAASGSGGPNPNLQIPQETPLGKHRRKGEQFDPKVEMETEPEGRDLGKEAEEEAAAAEAAQNAANRAAAANEASRIATEEANKSIAAAQNLAKEVLQAAQIPTPATPNTTQASASASASEAPDPGRILRELLLCPPGTVPPRSLTPIEALEARGESLPDNIHPAWMEWKSLKDSNKKYKQRPQS